MCIEVAQDSHDYEVDVVPTTLGIVILSTDDEGSVVRMPRLSGDEARTIAAALVLAADWLDAN